MRRSDCEFCKVIAGEISADVVFRDERLIAFLDWRPLFPGHLLLCPTDHFDTISDLPPDMGGPLLSAVQTLSRAVESALDAEGTFVAINNRVSQSVPHLHVHIVPRRRKDGLKGFFWPRHQYKDDASRAAVRDAIERQIAKIEKLA